MNQAETFLRQLEIDCNHYFGTKIETFNIWNYKQFQIKIINITRNWNLEMIGIRKNWQSQYLELQEI